jgi:hypothetical protein
VQYSMSAGLINTTLRASRPWDGSARSPPRHFFDAWQSVHQDATEVVQHAFLRLLSATSRLWQNDNFMEQSAFRRMRCLPVGFSWQHHFIKLDLTHLL